VGLGAKSKVRDRRSNRRVAYYRNALTGFLNIINLSTTVTDELSLGGVAGPTTPLEEMGSRPANGTNNKEILHA
jgi:hypothetical protein